MLIFTIKFTLNFPLPPFRFNKLPARYRTISALPCNCLLRSAFYSLPSPLRRKNNFYQIPHS